MQSKYVERKYLLLTRIRSCPGAFADLPCSVSDVAEFFRAGEGNSTEKLFWSQYAVPEHPVPFADQLKQLVELHKAAEQAMKGLIVRMWPGESLPDSYFGLMRQLVNACPQLEVIKRFVCIEGAQGFCPGESALGEDGRRKAGERGAAGGQGASPPRKVL